MNLAKTSLLNGIAVSAKLATSLALNKVLAVYVGPTGYALIGQFQNVVAMATTFASGAINTGVTKYTAEYYDNPSRQWEVWRTAAMMALLGAAVVSSLLVLFRVPLARWAFADERLSSIMVWLAGALVLLVLNGLMLAILVGRKAITTYVVANIVGSVVTAITATALVLLYGLYGALVAVAISQALACGVTAWLFTKSFRLPWKLMIGPINYNLARKLGGFAAMSGASALATPVALLLIRDGLAARLGWKGAGLWQALWKISDTHLMLITTTLSLYFLPRFSEIRNSADLKTEVIRAYLFVVPLVSASALALYLLRDRLIGALLTRAFMPLADVLGWQLLGDSLKVCSWIVAFTLISRARTKTIIVTEILFNGLLVILTLLGATVDGLRGTAIGYTLTYAAYGITMFLLFRSMLARLPASNAAS